MSTPKSLSISTDDKTARAAITPTATYDREALHAAIRDGRTLTPKILIDAGVPLRRTRLGPMIVGDLSLGVWDANTTMRGRLFSDVAGISGELTILNPQNGGSIGSLQFARGLFICGFQRSDGLNDLGLLRTIRKFSLISATVRFAQHLEVIGDWEVIDGGVFSFQKLRRVSGLMRVDGSNIGGFLSLQEIHELRVRGSFINLSAMIVPDYLPE